MKTAGLINGALKILTYCVENILNPSQGITVGSGDVRTYEKSVYEI